MHKDLLDLWDPAVRLDPQVDQGHKGLPDLSAPLDLSEHPDLLALPGPWGLRGPLERLDLLAPPGLSGPLDRKARPDLSALQVLRALPGV
ncbi:hypothetical protein D3C74_422730 [compost metagenome]